MMEFAWAVWATLAELAPWFLLGALVAGLLHGFAPSGFVRRRFSGYQGVWWSVFLGIPLPLCSCAVIPTGIGLRRNGASEGSSVAFLVATPQTGVDSVFVTAAFLGWPFAIYKLVVALILGVTAGVSVEWFGRGRSKTLQPAAEDRLTSASGSCCRSESVANGQGVDASFQESETTVNWNRLEASGSGPVPAERLPRSATVALEPLPRTVDRSSQESQTVPSCCQSIKASPVEPSCCGTAASTSNSAQARGSIGGGMVGYGVDSVKSALDIIHSIYLWVIMGVLLSAALSVWLPADWLSGWLGQAYGLQWLAALGIAAPLYVCATASVPIAAALVDRGLSVGASIIFLMAGPATNVATIGAVRSQFSSLAFWVYMATTILGSLLFAMLFDVVWPSGLTQVESPMAHDHLSWIGQGSAGVLLLVFAWFGWRRLRPGA